MKCNNCGKEIPDDSLFCEFCGAKVVRVETEPKPEDKETLANKNRFPLWAIIASAALFLLLIIVVSLKNGRKDYQYAYDLQPSLEAITHEWVDLGLSVKWASCNIGANAPEDIGDFFAWGETNPKQSFSWDNYMLCCTTPDDIYKYISVNEESTLLNLEYDAAHVRWGEGWRMPTRDEIWELVYSCDREIVNQNGVPGIRLTGKNNNSIFFPFSGKFIEDEQIDLGRVALWLCNLYPIWEPPFYAMYWGFEIPSWEEAEEYHPFENYNDRYIGLPIRPVYIYQY